MSACAPELSRPLTVDAVPPEGSDVSFSASADERLALAKRLGLVSVDGLEAVLRVMPIIADDGGRAWRVTGGLRAAVVQTCVVTLEPFPVALTEPVEAVFGESGAASSGIAEVTLDDETVEPLDHGAIDLGELVAQHLAVGLDPYPRGPGAVLDGAAAPAQTAAEDEARRPFSALRHLRRDDKR